MKIQNSIKAAVAAFLIGAASQATATTISINASGLPGYLNNNTYQGSFDGSAVLPVNFAINSIGFSFSFSDDADILTSVSGTPVTVAGTPVTAAVGTGGDKSITTPLTVTTNVTRTGEQESVLLSFGFVSFGAQTGTSIVGPVTVSQTDNPVLISTTYEKNSGKDGKVSCTSQEAQTNQACKATYTYTVTTNVTKTTTTDYSGNIALADSLLAYDDVLAALQSNKSLNFSLGVTGDITLTNAKLTLDYTETPEPGSLALFGIALLGAAGIRRARRG